MSVYKSHRWAGGCRCGRGAMERFRVTAADQFSIGERWTIRLGRRYELGTAARLCGFRRGLADCGVPSAAGSLPAQPRRHRPQTNMADDICGVLFVCAASISSIVRERRWSKCGHSMPSVRCSYRFAVNRLEEAASDLARHVTASEQESYEIRRWWVWYGLGPGCAHILQVTLSL